ncbi:antibiotic biosynthesis monooxygenase [Roseateles sp.]|uniref:antibiotic biosynthesis monooxygenase n=1 Tax=Roseateles sp. TaxID=1971397 RepID=UPI0025EA1BDC|nr:antibiotic biosynthesis monooxygenase [Roseateles sp.]MBV8036384.1 antibiotic biosynthesis monooxygenase [Roseateles sp.]
MATLIANTNTPQIAEGVSHQLEPASLVVCHEVRPGSEDAYEQWLKGIRAQTLRFEGHRGADVLRPVPGTHAYTVVVRFDSIDHLNAWLSSPDRRRAIAEVEPLLLTPDRISVRQGYDIWFTPAAPASRVPKKPKQYLMTAAVIFPLTLIVRWVLDAIAAGAGLQPPHIAMHLLTVMLVVALMVWAIFPTLTARLSPWLTR